VVARIGAPAPDQPKDDKTVLQVLTRGLLDANKVVVGIAIAVIALATVAYLVRRRR
jgi:hypothetical protein